MSSEPQNRIQSTDSLNYSQEGDTDQIDETNIENYEKLITRMEQDIAEYNTNIDELLTSCQIDQNRTINISRNIKNEMVKVQINIPCSIERAQNILIQDIPTTHSTSHKSVQNKQISFLLQQKQIIIENYQQSIRQSNQQLQKYKQHIIILTNKILQLEAQLSLSTQSNIQINEIDHQKFQVLIQKLQDQIQKQQQQQNQSSPINTLKIMKGEEMTLLELEQVETVQSCKGVIKFYTSRQLPTDFQQKIGSVPNLSDSLQQLKLKYLELEEQSSNQSSFLKNQIFVLIQQVQELKIQNQKNNNLLIEYEIKLSNRRDFYKVKLVDLQRMIKEKTKYLGDLDDEVEYVQNELREKMNKLSTVAEVVTQYSASVESLTSQLGQEKRKTTQFSKIIQQKNESHLLDLQRLNRSIQDLTKQYQTQSNYANDVYTQLKQQKNINIDLKGVVQKLWNQIKQLNEQYRQKQRQNDELRNSTQNEEQIQDMKRIIEDLSQQVNILKEDVFIKTQELQAIKHQYQQKQEQAQRYQSQIQLQLQTLNKLRQSSDKADDFIIQLKSQLSEVTSKLQQQQANNYSDLHAQFSTMKNKDLIQELKNMRIEDKNVSFEMILKLIDIIEQYALDIDNLENQNTQLRNLLIQYQQIIEQQLTEIKNYQTQTIPQYRLGKKTLSSIRYDSKFNLNISSNKSTNKQQQLQLIEELAAQLQEQRNNNANLNMRLKQTHKQLMQYQRQIFEKTQAINYLNLALIKASSSTFQSQEYKQQTLKSQNWQLQRQIQDLQTLNQNLEDNMKRMINNKNKQIQNLQYEISILDNSVIPDLKEQNNHYLRAVDKLETDNRRLTKQLQMFVRPTKPFEEMKILHETKEYKNTITLEQFKSKSFSLHTILYLMLRLLETIQSTGHLKSFHPEDIYIVGYNQQQPSFIKIKLAFCGGQHDNGIFMAPELIKGQKQSIQSVMWNYGLIFDYLLFKQPYYLKQLDVINKKSYEIRGKLPFLIQKLLRGLIVKDSKKRLSLQECRNILEIELQKQ